MGQHPVDSGVPAVLVSLGCRLSRWIRCKQRQGILPLLLKGIDEELDRDIGIRVPVFMWRVISPRDRKISAYHDICDPKPDGVPLMVQKPRNGPATTKGNMCHA